MTFQRASVYDIHKEVKSKRIRLESLFRVKIKNMSSVFYVAVRFRATTDTPVG